MLKFLIDYKQKNKLRNNIKVSKQAGKSVRPSPPTDKIDNIHHQDKLDPIDM